MLIDFRKNANVLTALEGSAKRNERMANDPYVVEGYELHACPDLVDRLEKLLAYTPGAKLAFAFGTPTLCTLSSRIFATAAGTHSLSLYLPEEEGWGLPHQEYGKPWRQGYAWARSRPHTPEDEQHLASLLRRAYSAAKKLDLGSS
jgi:hypothetical protein